jgi:hypothetical protein
MTRNPTLEMPNSFRSVSIGVFPDALVELFAGEGDEHGLGL